ncbi:uncharacterized protein L201_002037 [Kwoniella dendrophila CBS 6074]|uniref:Uncharacterized protein n=1 Tax=Kwoniella dendrophila CBS 6074 TaxID=1295534 RepID=A0AAX4JP19_9TREE
MTSSHEAVDYSIHSHSQREPRQHQQNSSRWIDHTEFKTYDYNDLYESNDIDDSQNTNNEKQRSNKHHTYDSDHTSVNEIDINPEQIYQPSITYAPSRSSISSRSSSYSSDSSLPATPLTPNFPCIKLPSENFHENQQQDQHKDQDRFRFRNQDQDPHETFTPTRKPQRENAIPERPQNNTIIHLQETPKAVISRSSVALNNRQLFSPQETPKKQITKLDKIVNESIQQLRTPPNSRLKSQVRQPLLEPQAIILRPTTFWRHHPLSPHALPGSSPSARLIRRATLIASPTIGIQHPNPDQETTRICVGLAGIDLDIDPRARKLSLLPI